MKRVFLGWNVEGVDISAFGVEYARMFRDRLSIYFPGLASGLKVFEKALGASNWSLYINPMDIIQVTARLR